MSSNTRLALFCDARLWLSSPKSFIKSHLVYSTNKMNEFYYFFQNLILFFSFSHSSNLADMMWFLRLTVRTMNHVLSLHVFLVLARFFSGCSGFPQSPKTCRPDDWIINCLLVWKKCVNDGLSICPVCFPVFSWGNRL